MLRQQRDPKIKFVLGYDVEKSSFSSTSKNKSYGTMETRKKEHKINSWKLQPKDKQGEHKKLNGWLKHRRPDDKRRRYQRETY